MSLFVHIYVYVYRYTYMYVYSNYQRVKELFRYIIYVYDVNGNKFREFDETKIRSIIKRVLSSNLEKSYNDIKFAN